MKVALLLVAAMVVAGCAGSPAAPTSSSAPEKQAPASSSSRPAPSTVPSPSPSSSNPPPSSSSSSSSSSSAPASSSSSSSSSANPPASLAPPTNEQKLSWQDKVGPQFCADAQGRIVCPPPLPARGPGIPRGNPAPTYLNDPAGVLLRGNLTLTWASTSPGTDSLHIIGSIVRDCNPRCQVVTRLVDLNGTSPLQVALPAGGQTMLPSDLVAFTVMPAWSQGGRVRFSIGQDFDLEGVLDFVA